MHIVPFSKKVLPIAVLALASLFSPDALGQNLRAHWKLNESSGTSASDSTGNGYTGTVTGTATWTSGMINNCFSFNGSTKIEIGNLLGNPASLSVACWVNITASDSAGAEAISLGDYVVLRVHNVSDGGPTGSIYIGGSTWVNVITTTSYVGTGWHHFVLTFDDSGNSVKLYIDGALAASNTTSSSIVWTGLGSATRIGRHGNTRTDLDLTGLVDDARVYDYALSAAEILDLYGKIAHWKLNESSGTSAADSSAYNRTGTVTGTASWTSAVLNNGFSFNGSTKIQATGLLGSPSSFTVAAWGNLTTADTSGAEVISLGDRVYLRLDESGATKVAFYNGSSFVTASVATTYAGTGWHHFAGVFSNSGDSLKLYVDGVQVASTTTTSNVSYSGGGSNTVIGRQGNSGTSNDFTGLMDDIRAYNYALSASDVAELYGFVGHWKLNHTSSTTATDSSPFATNGTVSGTANWSTDCGGMRVFDFNGSTNYVSIANASHLQPIESLTIAAWIKGDSWGAGSDVDTILRKGDSPPNNYKLDIADGKVELGLDVNDDAGIQSTTTLSTGVWYHVAATWDGAIVKIYINGELDSSTARTGTIATDTRSLYIGGRSGTDLFNGMIRDVRLYNRALQQSDIRKLAGPVGYWQFGEGSGTTAADSSGIGNNATLSGGATWTTNCAGDYALLTNGTGGVAQTASSFSPPEAGTVAFWMKSSGTPASTSRLFGTGADWEGRQITDGRLIFDLCADGGSTIGTTIPLNESGRWYHVAATYDSDTDGYAIYIDGELDASGTNSNDLIAQSAAILSFGTRTGSTEYWQGALRDFRVYNRRLCASDIAELCGSIGYWTLNETTGTTAVNSAPAGTNGSYVNGVTLGETGPASGTYAAQFDGSNDYVSLPSDSSDFSQGLTFAVWARPTAAGSWARFIELGVTQDSYNIFLARQSTTTTLELAIHGNSSTKTYVRASSAITLNEWHHYAGTVNAAGLAKLYKDGAEISITSGSSGYPTIGVPASVTRSSNFIGRSNWAADAYYQGKMYDARVYNRALCPTEIQALYDGGNAFEGVKIIKWVEIQ